MSPRRTPSLAAAAVLIALVGGCGSHADPQTAPIATPTVATPGTAATSPADLASPSTPAATASAPPAIPSFLPGISDLHVAVVDATAGDWVVGVGFDDSSQSLVDVGIHGLGRAWPDGRATVRRTPEGMRLTYDGPGEVDPTADLGNGYSSRSLPPPAHPHAARLRIDATATAAGEAHADVWVDGRHYEVTSTTVPHTADAVLAIVARDYSDNDWGDLYDHSWQLGGGLTRAEAVRLFARDTSRATMTVTGPLTYTTVDGVASASAPVHLVGEMAGRSVDRDVTVHLVYQDGAWLFYRVGA